VETTFWSINNSEGYEPKLEDEDEDFDKEGRRPKKQK